MTSLSDHQKQLLFDYSLGLASEREAAEAEELLSWNPEAIALHHTLELTLAPLDTVEFDPCPDELTERLFERLREAARQGSEAKRLEELLAAERFRARTIKIPLWRNWSEVAAAAAAVVLFVSVLFPSVGFMRQQYAQRQCGAQLGSIYEAFRNYVSDHDGLLPAVSIAPDSPWWKVGYQGQENYSNTRGPWLLVKYKYVPPDRFLCSGRRELYDKVNYEGFEVQNWNDFPSRIYIHYSVPIAGPTARDRDLNRKGVLMADRNPMSESLPSDLSEPCRLRLVEQLMRANSANHRGRGQNVLLYDGSVEFRNQRHASISDDDIYTLQGMSCGMEVTGCEQPSSSTDIFLVN